MLQYWGHTSNIHLWVSFQGHISWLCCISAGRQLIFSLLWTAVQSAGLCIYPGVPFLEQVCNPEVSQWLVLVLTDLIKWFTKLIRHGGGWEGGLCGQESLLLFEGTPVQFSESTLGSSQEIQQTLLAFQGTHIHGLYRRTYLHTNKHKINLLDAHRTQSMHRFCFFFNTFRDFLAVVISVCVCQSGPCSYDMAIFQGAQLVLCLQLERIFLVETAHRRYVLSEFNKLLLAISSFPIYLIKLAKV